MASNKSANKPPKKVSIAGGNHYRIRESVRFNRKTKPKKKNIEKTVKKVVPVPRARALIKVSLQFTWKYKLQLLAVLALYSVGYILLVTGLSSTTDPKVIKESLEQYLGSSALVNNVVTAGIVMISSGSSSSDSAKAYQTILPILGSLAFIWTVRRLMSEKPFRVRDAFYLSMQPLFPFTVIILNIALKLIPMAIGSYLFTLIRASGYASGGVEMFLVAVVWLLLVAWSFYMLVPAVLSMYAVTLPNVYPRQAFKATRQLVRTQRWRVLARMLVGVLLGLLVGSLIVVAAIAWANAIVVPLTLFLGFLGLMLLHVYFYHIYRSIM